MVIDYLRKTLEVDPVQQGALRYYPIAIRKLNQRS